MPNALLLVFLFTLFSATAVIAQVPQPARQALLICIDDYEGDEDSAEPTTLPDLDEPCRDADILAARLVQLGWNETNEIRRLRNPRTEHMLRAFRGLSTFLNARPGRFGFVYLAGHGAEVNNKTYVFEHMARLDFAEAADILSGGNDRRLFAESAIELSSDVFADLSYCFCDVVVVVDVCRNDPVAFTRLSGELAAARQIPGARRSRQREIVITAPQRRLLPSGLGTMYATSEPASILDASPTRLALMLDIEMQPDLTIHQVLSLAARQVRDQSRLTQFPQSPSLSYAANNPFWCFNRCAEPASGTQGLNLSDPRQSAAAALSGGLTPIRYQLPGATTADNGLGRARVVREPADGIAARNSGAIAVDVFWCEEGNDEGRFRHAETFAQNLSSQGDQGITFGERPLGRVRLRPLALEDNDRIGYRISENIVRTDRDAAAEDAWARGMRGLSPQRLSIERQRSVSPDYIGVFFCEGVPTRDEGPRLWMYVANRAQMPLATDIGLGLRDRDVDIWIGDDIEVVRGVNHSQIRYYFQDDAALAARIAQEIEAQGLLSHPPTVRYLPIYRDPSMEPGLVELQIGRNEDAQRRD